MHVDLIQSDEFGKMVAAHLAYLLPAMVQLPNEASPALDALTVLISGTSDPAHALDLDDRAYRTHSSFLPVNFDHAVLTLGPIVIPGQGACFHCFELRKAQHRGTQRPSGDADMILQPIAALLAASLLADLIQSHASGSSVAGSVLLVELVPSTFTRSVVVGVHACPRCGLKRDPKSLSYLELRQSCSYLWTKKERQERT